MFPFKKKPVAPKTFSQKLTGMLVTVIMHTVFAIAAATIFIPLLILNILAKSGPSK